MSVATIPPTLVHVFRRSRKSLPAPLPAFEASPDGEPAGVRVEHVQEWRDAAKRVARAYQVWCAASGSDQEERYNAFLDALRLEEMAAQQVERDASSFGSPDPGASRAAPAYEALGTRRYR